jgi:type II secretion system protein G
MVVRYLAGLSLVVGMLSCARTAESKGLFNVGDIGAGMKGSYAKKNSEAEYTKTIIETIDFVLNQYHVDNGAYPTTVQGLEALVKPPLEGPVPPNWRGPYIGRVPKDAWGRPFHYASPGDHNKDGYDVSSYGPDGVASSDDITNWS